SQARKPIRRAWGARSKNFRCVMLIVKERGREGSPPSRRGSGGWLFGRAAWLEPNVLFPEEGGLPEVERETRGPERQRDLNDEGERDGSDRKRLQDERLERIMEYVDAVRDLPEVAHDP